MEFGILGPFEVRDGGQVVSVSRQKQRALLARLALQAGQTLTVDRLIEDLWGERPPTSARSSLQNLVSQLRRVLGDEVLQTRPSGYVLNIEPEAVDALRFERLVADAGRASGHERVDLLRGALALWRGPPLADLTFEPFALAAIERLEERGVGVQEDLIDAELAVGLPADLVPRIEALVVRNPLRERPRGQLMLALYRSGRQVEALTAYQDLRHVLVEELGVEPSAALRELEQAILRQDAALSPAAAEEQPAQREVRRTATVLFAEVAVAEPAVGLGAEVAHRLGVRALGEMRAATEYHGGSVGRASGDELLAVFAGHEDDPRRAAGAALQMRRALEALGRSQEPAIEIRAAVSTGTLVVSDATGLAQAGGRVVVLARRLAATALAGEILLDAATASTAGAAITAEPVEPRTLRGEAEPVAAQRLLAASGPAARVSSDAPMVGRAHELERLAAAYEEAQAECCCRVAVVAGEAGLGKTRLTAEFARSAAAGGAAVLVGRCVSYGEGATYLPLREVIVQAAGEDPRAAIAQRLAGDEHAEVVARQVAELVSPGGGAGSTGEAFWAVRRFLEALAAERPLVLIFDDVHWAEPTFLDLVEYLEQWSRAAPLLVVCVTRPELLESRPGWTAHAIPLKPLAGPDAEALVELLAADVPAAIRARIVELAEGNPLYAEQLAARAAEGAGALDTVPPSLEALISSRIDRLAPGERAVLQRAAVVGREFWHGAVLQLSDQLEVPSVGRHLLDLARKGLIRPGRPLFPREDGFSFHHVLIRDVAYAAVPAGLRADLHEQVADWLETQAPDQDELIGYHLEHAYLCRVESGASQRQARRLASDAGDRLATAGLRAWKRGDLPAAANLLGRAGTLLEPAEAVRRDVLVELGVARAAAGDYRGAIEQLRASLEAAEAARDRRAELRSRIELASVSLYRESEGGTHELLALIESSVPALEELGDDRALGRAWLAAASVHGPSHCQYRAAEQAVLRALDYFRRSGWPSSGCQGALAGNLFYGPATVEDGIAGCRSLLEEADLVAEANVLGYLSGLEAMRGRFDDARSLAARSRTLYEELGWTYRATTWVASLRGGIELLAGDFAAAEAVLGASCAAMTERRDWGRLSTQAAQLGEVLYRQGRYDEAATWAAAAADRAADDDTEAQSRWRALRAKVLARSGATGEAEELAREAVRLRSASDALSERGDVLLDLAEVQCLAERPDDARAAVEEARELYERKGNTVSAARAAGLLAELSVA